jgi:Xaa-Pro aminopeptidase
VEDQQPESEVIVVANGQRREQLEERMDALGVDLVFLPPSADLEYLTGFKRRVLTFGNIEYAHSWVTGCFIGRDREPAFVLPRMVVAFETPEALTGDVSVVSELDDGAAIFRQVAKSFGPVRKLAVGARAWSDTTIRLLQIFDGPEVVNADLLLNPLRRVKSKEELEVMTQACRLVDEVMGEVSPHVVSGAEELGLARDIDFLMRSKGSLGPSFDTGVWGMGPPTGRDAPVRVTRATVEPGLAISFDFGSVVSGYCSDFGRTIQIGEPSPDFSRAYDAVIEAQAAGIRAVRPGVPVSSVHAACRGVIVEAGFGEWFRHRTGHCIGLDVHEQPFISEEDNTPLEVGMTFTIEPSVYRPGYYGARVEDVIVCEEGGGRKLNQYPTTMVVHD